MKKKASWLIWDDCWFSGWKSCFIEFGISASRYKVAITKHKDLEQTSSSMYNQNNIWTPAVDFSKYIADNENIVEQVC